MAKKELRYATFDTNFGWQGVLASSKGLLQLTLPQATQEAALEALGDRLRFASWSESFTDLESRLKAYFQGKKANFPDRLDLTDATDFQRQVWEAARNIPYGQTRSYSWVADTLGRPDAARAVGQALGRNPLPIVVPCHRVLGSNGGLCGFAGGTEIKRYLLNLEG